MKRGAPLLARGLVLVFAMALAMAGFGHRFASASDLERAQFAQLYGAEFCVTDDEGAPRAATSCPVCHLVAGLYLAAAIEGAVAPANLTLRVRPPVAARHLLASTEAAPPPSRGPPSV
ncbi:hypothetical protein [Pararhodobacter aggregans]|uniref:DUF2946 domain-containing protein n=1 Tax=Pararhodobacter aggregans TaxID=404875 RepID=A0A2T7UQ52_9RHOB|nr:hypothetical protein [Pararhodobacter aggregans]PTX01529.1 hypothetical protein C8N33_10795 [Pararhodobacter aggregans]PVE46797.1 hypothetical protein DDE23_14010 [Pararhodobacter aggregans]